MVNEVVPEAEVTGGAAARFNLIQFGQFHPYKKNLTHAIPLMYIGL